MTRLWCGVLLLVLAGCAKSADGMYANVSAGGTGCEPAEMTISADATPYAWKVTCRGKTFSCTAPQGAPNGAALCVAE
ncbi:MAG: hypothetical protein MUC96_03000 [Myxococcaceae bacterium]|jgi:hypothetical protein|nr:hypothetical protein [Myxococcaceae bacterium]